MIREVSDQDAEAIAEIYNHYITNTIITFEETEISPVDILNRIKRVKETGFPWFVAEENGKVIGYTYASQWKDRSAYKYTAEVSVYIQKDLKSKGWGTKLYEKLFESLRVRGFHVAIGGLAMPNPGSKALHEKFGMRQVAHFREVGFKFGRRLDVIYLQGILQDKKTFDFQPTLKGELLTLRPLTANDFEELYNIASDPQVWEQHPRWDRYKKEVFQPFMQSGLDSGGSLVVIDNQTGKLIGSTRYLAYDQEKSEVEIGFTFLGIEYWGGTYNGEMKKLMLDHAFQWVNSVVFLVGPTNTRSQKSVEKIGAVRDGVRTDATGLEAWLYRINKSSWKCE
jgi:L-amino acid N-acyltransferase YncA